jgi:hypothetical protein
VAAGELSRQTLDGVHPGVAEFDGYRDGVDGDMAGLTQCGRRPGFPASSRAGSAVLPGVLIVSINCRSAAGADTRRHNVIYITL